MNVKEIKEMIQLMNENNLTELELEKDGLKIRLKKNSSGHIESSFLPEGRQVFTPIQPQPTAVPVAVIPKVNIKCPMVGTFYAAPAPDQPPYVTKGKKVQEGDVLCIVEAMKLMNEIKCEVSGTVVDILVQNGQPVEYDQPLFKIETA